MENLHGAYSIFISYYYVYYVKKTVFFHKHEFICLLAFFCLLCLFFLVLIKGAYSSCNCVRVLFTNETVSLINH